VSCGGTRQDPATETRIQEDRYTGKHSANRRHLQILPLHLLTPARIKGNLAHRLRPRLSQFSYKGAQTGTAAASAISSIVSNTNRTRSVLPTTHRTDARSLFAAHPDMSQFDIIRSRAILDATRKFSPVHEFCKASLRRGQQARADSVIVKTRPTQPQKEIQTLPQKRDNVAGAFAVNG
jgi:hypothetical protein